MGRSDVDPRGATWTSWLSRNFRVWPCTSLASQVVALLPTWCSRKPSRCPRIPLCTRGHIITNQKGGRADLYLKINNGMRDYALSEDSTGQWVDLTVNHATTLKKGKYTFQITSNKNARFGCGAGWGDLDIVVVPKFKGVAAYNQPD